MGAIVSEATAAAAVVVAIAAGRAECLAGEVVELGAVALALLEVDDLIDPVLGCTDVVSEPGEDLGLFGCSLLDRA